MNEQSLSHDILEPVRDLMSIRLGLMRRYVNDGRLSSMFHELQLIGVTNLVVSDDLYSVLLEACNERAAVLGLAPIRDKALLTMLGSAVLRKSVLFPPPLDQGAVDDVSTG